jgi:uncharacterized DUF497 family protein
MDDDVRFEWDSRKAEANKRKHGISFDFAKLVFRDALVKLELESYDHGEERWRSTGQIGRAIIVVSHTIHEKDGVEIVRIISARRAQPQERRRYERHS